MVTEDLIKATYKDRVTPKYEEKLLAKFMECKNTLGKRKIVFCLIIFMPLEVQYIAFISIELAR